MSLAGKRVLVTGAGGFIGSHLTETLVEAGARPRAFVHYRSNGSWGWLNRSPRSGEIEIIAGDIRDQESVTRAMQGVDVVFHLAALIGIPYSYEAPSSYVRTNIEGTLNVLTAARQAGVGRVVHTSTSEVYGSATYVPMDEKHPLQGQSPYSASKIGADKMAESFYLSFGLPVVTLRPFNTFGPRQSARAVIPTIITQCLAGKAVRLGHLHPTRDFNFVSNTVDGFVLAATAERAEGHTINIGSGEEISIRDLASRIGGLLAREVDIEGENDRKRPENSEVDRLLADNRLAAEVLGWKPLISFEQGLYRTIEWIRAHQDEYRVGAYVV